MKLLLQCEMASLSEIAEKLEHDHGWKITLPGLFKHMKKLENAGIIRTGSGGIIEVYLDARKTIYLLEGKERVEKILEQLDTEVVGMLQAGAIFHRTAMLSRKIHMRGYLTTGDRNRLNSLLTECESEEVGSYLTEDEKRKLKLWRMMMEFLE